MGYKSHYNEVSTQIRNKIDKNAREAAFVLVGEMRKTCSGDRSGREYQVPGTGRSYTASRPGEPPARRTGDLVRSFDVKQVEVGRWLVGNSRKYALYLEKGTSRMEPRPYFVRTMREQFKRIQRLLSR